LREGRAVPGCASNLRVMDFGTITFTAAAVFRKVVQIAVQAEDSRVIDVGRKGLDVGPYGKSSAAGTCT